MLDNPLNFLPLTIILNLLFHPILRTIVIAFIVSIICTIVIGTITITIDKLKK